jgi:hypothetical protein
MSDGYETLDVLEPWLVALLTDVTIDSADPNLVDHVVNAQTTESISPPYLLLWHISSRDILGVGGTRVDTDNIYGVKAVHQINSFVPGRAVMRAVDAALHNMNVTTLNGSLTCVRESTFHYPETIDGVQFMHVGAQYRLRATSD